MAPSNANAPGNDEIRKTYERLRWMDRDEVQIATFLDITVEELRTAVNTNKPL